MCVVLLINLRKMFTLYQCPLDLYLGTSVPELFEIPTSIEFVRDYVAKNMPVVIREGISCNLEKPQI